MPLPDPTHLADRLDALQAEGRYAITLSELLEEGSGSADAIRAAIRRLKRKGRLAQPRRGFLVIVPPEYRSLGCLPATWFIDDLMRYLGQPYYVGILSAAAIHGASHQKPQVFQVITSEPTPRMQAGRVRLEFFRKRALEASAVQRVPTETGTIAVSTPETTLFDLIRHAPAAGFLSNVATVLVELGEVVRPEALREAAAVARRTEVQRAGYLLERVGHDGLARVLEQYLGSRTARRVPLFPGAPADGPFDARWKLVVNDVVEPDL